MNKEIKETLEYLKICVEDDTSFETTNCKALLDYITNLQEELKIRDTNWQSLKYYLEKLYDRDYIEEEIFDDICKRVNELESQIEIKSYQKEITNLQQENQRLKNLCDKYEEEHNTAFKLWTMKMEEMPTYEEKIEIQKENERLKEKENKLQEKFKDWKKEIEKERKHYLCDRTDCCGRIKNSRKYNSIYQELKTYKSRCEKEIEYIHNHQLVFELSSKKQIQDWFDMFYKDSLNILNGEYEKR